MKDVTKSNSLCLHKVGSLEAIKTVSNNKTKIKTKEIIKHLNSGVKKQHFARSKFKVKRIKHSNSTKV